MIPRHQHTIALVGLSGAGKSTVGRLLAGRLGGALLDTDALVIEAAGRGIPEIFAAEGEDGFRDREGAALRAALARAPRVIATGGGLILRAENRALLRGHAYVVWLDAPTEALVARLLAHDEPRPLLAVAEPAARLEQQRAARAALYAEVADLRVQTAGLSAEAICEQILAQYRIPIESEHLSGGTP